MKSPIKRRKNGPSVEIPPEAESRASRLETGDLIALIEASVGRGAEVFRGFNHGELDRMWVTSELEAQLVQALGACRALKNRLETAQAFDS